MDPQRIRRRLLDWYADHHRRLPWRETTDPYAIWVSEVMLQQTQVATAIPYYRRFMASFPTPADLAAADLDTVLKSWEGLGYYSRARNLHRAAGLVVARHDGQVPDDPDAFRALPGVGDYIAAAVMSIAFGRVMAVVDGNVKRVLARLFEIDAPVNRSGSHKRFQARAAQLISREQPSDFNQAMMELGALVCRPRSPDCTACPLAGECRACSNGTTAEYPQRDAAKKIPHRHQAVGVIVKAGRMLVIRRPTTGFLGGLWEFPAVAAAEGPEASAGVAVALREETGLAVAVLRPLTRIRHAYTHFTLSADVYLCRFVGGRVRHRPDRDHRWVTLRALKRLPVHKANLKFMDRLAAAVAEGSG